MPGSPFETVRNDPFKERAGRNGKAKGKRMPKGITPPISDPFHVSAPTHAQMFFNPLQSKSTRAALSQSAQVRALTAAAAASASARAARGRVAAAPAVLRIAEPRAEAQWSDPALKPVQESATVEPLFAERVEEEAPAATPLTLAADGQGPAPQHPAGPQVSTSSSAYYGSRGGGNGNGSGGGSGDGTDGGDTIEPVQDDIVAGVLVAAFALLFGWAGYNALVGSGGVSDDGERLLSPQSADVQPAGNMTTQIDDLSAPNPFPPGPVDIRPSSPIETQIDPAEDDALQTQLRAPAAPTELAQAQIQTQVETEPAAPVAPACAPGRAMRAYFCTASANLTPTARTALLAEIRDWGACAASNELVVRGYADTRGAMSMNAALAASRAGSVAALLREQGLSVTEVEGVGELSQIEDERNCANQRRVDVSIKGDPAPANLACTPPAEAQSMICA